MPSVIGDHVLIFVGLELYALFFLQNSINNSSVPMPKRAFVDASGTGVVVNDKGGLIGVTLVQSKEFCIFNPSLEENHPIRYGLRVSCTPSRPD